MGSVMYGPPSPGQVVRIGSLLRSGVVSTICWRGGTPDEGAPEGDDEGGAGRKDEADVGEVMNRARSLAYDLSRTCGRRTAPPGRRGRRGTATGAGPPAPPRRRSPARGPWRVLSRRRPRRGWPSRPAAHHPA